MFTNPKTRAFTLFEVMLALGILVLLTGSIFAILQASLAAVEEIQKQQQRWKEAFTKRTENIIPG
jgi:type II secretory pathway component PulJ